MNYTSSSLILPPSSLAFTRAFILQRAFVLLLLPRKFLVEILTADTQNARRLGFVPFSSLQYLLHILSFDLGQGGRLLESLLDPNRKLNRLRQVVQCDLLAGRN